MSLRLYLGRHVSEPPLMLQPARRVAVLKQWIAATERAAAKEDAAAATWLWIVLAFQIDALLGPTGLLHVELERLIEGSDDARVYRGGFQRIATRRDLEKDLAFAYARHEAGEPLRATTLQQGNDTSDARGARARAIALYTPAETLARAAMGPGLAELLSLPFRVVAPEAFPSQEASLAPARGGELDGKAVRAALAAAIELASAEWPSLRMTADAIEVATVDDFVRSFNEALQRQVLDAKAPKARAAKAKRATKAAKPAAEPDWHAIERSIVARGAAAVRAYAKEHGAAGALVLDTDPPAGYVLFSFTSAADLLATASAHLRQEAEQRAKPLAAKAAWTDAAQLAAPRLADAISPGNFEDMDYDRVDFGDAIERFAASAACPESPPGVEPYATARFRIALCRALDRLVADGALAPVVGDAPLFVGYTLHEEPTVVLHVIARATRAPSSAADTMPPA